ncbi:MAG: hypothetical protein AAF518_03250 [Spirochaetota bacterium]
MQVKIIVEPNDYIDAFNKGEPVKIVLKRFSFDQLGDIYYVLGQLLNHKELSHLYPLLQTALKELVQNAIKATRKRLFYKKIGLDIVTQHDEGLDRFRESFEELTPDDFSIANEIMEYTAEVSFFCYPQYLLISVRNYGEMLEQERKNVDFMLERGLKFSQVADILSDEVQTREGGGLGLSMIVILLKNAKLPTDGIFYESENSYTTFYIKLPFATLE